MDRYKRYTPYNCACGVGNRMPTAKANVDSSRYCLCDSQPIPLAMAYVKKQDFKELYTPAEALNKGTVFAELYMPYCIGGKRR